MKEYFILTDIHSCYDEMIKTLNNNKFDINNKNHIIICCGDLLDRGAKPKEVIDFFYDLMQKERLILIKGNHEDLFKSLIDCGPAPVHAYNGTIDTLCVLTDSKTNDKVSDMLKNKDENEYIKKMNVLISNSLDFYETNNYVFVHGWIPIFLGDDWRKGDRRDWYDARWENGITCGFGGHILNDKIIVCGHRCCAYARIMEITNEHPDKKSECEDRFMNPKDNQDLFDIYYGTGFIALDALTVHSGKCNCLYLTEEEM